MRMVEIIEAVAREKDCDVKDCDVKDCFPFVIGFRVSSGSGFIALVVRMTTTHVIYDQLIDFDEYLESEDDYGQDLILSDHEYTLEDSLNPKLEQFNEDIQEILHEEKTQ